MKTEEPINLIVSKDSKIVNYELEFILTAFEGSPVIKYKKRSQLFFDNNGFNIDSLKTGSRNFAIDWNGQRKEYNISIQDLNNFILKEFDALTSSDFTLYNLNP
jgi:hypothetical protein